MSNPATPHDVNGTHLGTVLTLFGTVYTVSNIVISNTNPGEGEEARVTVAHLGQTTGETLAQMDRPLVVPAADGGTGRQVTFDYIGKTVILDGATGTLTIVTAGTSLVNKPATVQSTTLTLSLNDAVRGQATISIAR